MYAEINLFACGTFQSKLSAAILYRWRTFKHQGIPFFYENMTAVGTCIGFSGVD